MTEKEQRIEELLDHLASYAPLPDPNLPILENDSFLYHHLTSMESGGLLHTINGGDSSLSFVNVKVMRVVFELIRYMMAQGVTKSHIKDLILNGEGPKRRSFTQTSVLFRRKLVYYDRLCKATDSNVHDYSHDKRETLIELFLALKREMDSTGSPGYMIFTITEDEYRGTLARCTTSYRPPIVLSEQLEQLAVHLAKVRFDSRVDIPCLGSTNNATREAYRPIKDYLARTKRLTEADSEHLKPLLKTYMECLVNALLALNKEPYYFKYNGMKIARLSTEMLVKGRTVRECLETLHTDYSTEANNIYYATRKLLTSYIYRLKVIQKVGTVMGFDLLGEYLDTYHIPETTPIITNEDWSL